jgi:hypothetical protein
MIKRKKQKKKQKQQFFYLKKKLKSPSSKFETKLQSQELNL